MKFSLALVLVSLSVLTTAKHEFVRKTNGNHNPSPPCVSPVDPANPNVCPPAPKHEFVRKANGNYNPSQPGGNGASPSVAPANANGGKGNGGTPANSQPKETGTGSTSGKSSSGWVQNPSGKASFTGRSGCQSPSCGQKVNGYSAAVNELAYGANSGTGGACGRCFKVVPTSDPYTPSSKGPFGNSIVVKVNDLCTASSNNEFCDQTASNPLNHHNMPMHFELCTDSGAPGAFFPGNNTAMLGTYEEVSCSDWSGSDGEKVSDKSCMAGKDVGVWPNTGCSNSGTPPA